MKLLTKVIVLIGLALFLANASFAQQVKTDYDRAANFSQYKTYSWKKVQTSDPLWVDRIKAAVDAALAAKGWILHDRQKMVDTLLKLKQGPATEEVHAIPDVRPTSTVRIKRYRSD
jgi:hypothetical protein